jgi:hypothetical protein
MIWSGMLPASARIKIGEAAHLDAGNRVLHAALARLFPAAALRVAPAWFSLGKPALERAHVAHHQQHPARLSDLREPLADGIAAPQSEHVVVEEEHPGNVDAVRASLQLGKNHEAELVAGGAWTGEHIRNVHRTSRERVSRFSAILATHSTDSARPSAEARSDCLHARFDPATRAAGAYC